MVGASNCTAGASNRAVVALNRASKTVSRERTPPNRGVLLPKVPGNKSVHATRLSYLIPNACPRIPLPGRRQGGIPSYIDCLLNWMLGVWTSGVRHFLPMPEGATAGYVATELFLATPTKWTYRAIYRVGDQRVASGVSR